MVDYTSRDYASLRQAMLDDALIKLPEWTSRADNDYGVLLIEEFAYVGDILSYYVDRLVGESFLGTATQRSSLLNIAALLDYRPDTGHASSVVLTIGVVPGTGSILIPAGSQFSSASDQPEVAPTVIFETDADLHITQDASVVATGTVSATQGTAVTDESLGTSDGTAGQRRELITRSVIEGSVRLSVDEGSGPSTWTFVEHLIDYGPTSPVFTTSTDAFGVTTVEFGDGVNGQIPAVGAALSATYRVGGGTVGNVGAGTINTIVNAPAAVSSVFNQVDAVGGTDAESNDQIRVNAPKSLGALQRAVTLEDYAALTVRVVGAAKAKATGTSYTNIHVYVAPSGGGSPDSVLLTRISDYLADKKMVNASVTVEEGTYVPVTIEAGVYVADAYSQSAVSTAARNALSGLLAFDNVDFGQQITLSDVYAVLNAVPGVVYSAVTVLARTSDGDVVEDVMLEDNEIPTESGGAVSVTVLGGGVSSSAGGAGGLGGDVIPSAPGAPTIDSISCGTAHAFTLTCHWTAAGGATTYNVILDFYSGSTYMGTLNGGSASTTSATVNGTFAGADTVKVHIQAVNGDNITDGPVTTSAYACG